MSSDGLLLLSGADVAELLSLDDCIAAVDQAFRLQGEGRVHPPAILGMHSPEGGFHIKAALLDLSRPYFAAKINANFVRNRERFQLPTIQGVVALFDAGNGRPLALIDSIQITLLRTAAATAVAAKHLARPESRVAVLCGCGVQGRVQLRALTRVLPIEKVHAYDTNAEAARRLSHDLGASLRIDIAPVPEPGPALGESDVCVTCTPSRQALIRGDDVPPGLFIAAVGADSSEKRELDAKILAKARLVVDSREQCATIGELHHALQEGTIDRPEVATEIAEIVAGKKPGRQSSDEIIVFDSTGVALEDVAAAAMVYERAVQAGRGQAWMASGLPTRNPDSSLEGSRFLIQID